MAQNFNIPKKDYQFPNPMNNQQKPKNFSPKIGQNTQGSQPKGGYQGQAGHFQYGTGQYGHINQQGKINWNTTPNINKTRFIAAKPAWRWGQQSGQKPVDPYGMPTTRRGYDFAEGKGDPQYSRAAGELIAQRDMTQQQYANRIAEMQDTYRARLSQLQSDYSSREQQEQASLGSSGFARSGMVNTAALERGSDLANMRRELDTTLGTPARERLHSERGLVDSRLRQAIQSEQALASERWTAENKYREAMLESPQTDKSQPKGFFKRGSTWFYRDKDGVEVSVAAPPDRIRKKLAKGKK